MIRSRNTIAQPTRRRLRVFAFDPAASVQLETAVINDAVIDLQWERPWEGDIELGPTNDYLEVIDYDPSSGKFYEPIDLNDPFILAQDGLPPSEANPQFHQQMVFAVAMKTIRIFERALGRPVFWAMPEDDPRVLAKRDGKAGAKDYPPFIKRLRIYPHALRQANAYYSPAKGALLFGYFKAKPRFADDEGEWVFTCLSQDIIAHETAHAILHGMRRRSVEATNPDSLAFHEAFADIIALMQHFTMDNVVRHELGRNGGKLRSANLLTGLASQFGEATGRNGPLRQALDILSSEQTARENDRVVVTKTLKDAKEPHERGQYLVVAVFDAFVTIYERRTRDLFAMTGTRPGDDRLSDQLIARLADEASKVANSVLNICVRGLDYLPPADATFGDFLRAAITADFDLVPEDPLKYRVAFAESFRKREIPAPGCMSYAPDSLCWEPPDVSAFERGDDDPTLLFADALKGLTLYARVNGQSPRRLPVKGNDPRNYDHNSALDAYIISDNSSYSAGSKDKKRNLREEAMRVVMRNQVALHTWLVNPEEIEIERQWEALLGLRTLPLGKPLNEPAGTIGQSSPKSISAIAADPSKLHDGWADVWLQDGKAGDKLLLPRLEVHSARISRRAGPDGNELFQLIAQVTQRRMGFFDSAVQKQVDRDGPLPRQNPDFWFRGGATIMVDLRDGRLQRVIRQRIDNETRLERQRKFVLGDDVALAMAANRGKSGVAGNPLAVSALESEPFAFLHGAA